MGITLRALRGASRLDVDWRRVGVSRARPPATERMDATTTALDDVCFPYDDNEKTEALRARLNYTQAVQKS